VQLTNEYALILGTGKGLQDLTRDAHTIKDLKALWAQQSKGSDGQSKVMASPSVNDSLASGGSALKDPTQGLRRAVLRSTSNCILLHELMKKAYCGKRFKLEELLEHLQPLADAQLGVIVKLMPNEPNPACKRKDYGKYYFKKILIKPKLAEITACAADDEEGKNPPFPLLTFMHRFKQACGTGERIVQHREDHETLGTLL
jgi:hypothetical protein